MRFHPKRWIVFLVASLTAFLGFFAFLQQLEFPPRTTTSLQSANNMYQEQDAFHELEPRERLEVHIRSTNDSARGLYRLQDDKDEGGVIFEAVKKQQIGSRRHEPFHEDTDTEKQNKGGNARRKSTNSKSVKSADIWPDPNKPWEDRIVAQLQYVPESYTESQPLKTIYLPGGSSDPMGQEYFKKFECPVSACSLTNKAADADEADAVVFGLEGYVAKNRNPRQIWVLYLLESPLNTGPFDSYRDQINWTATYRMDSTLVTPYEKFVFHQNATSVPLVPTKNYAQRKTKLVAWFVSNCGARNKRKEFVEELQKYIQVDVYGQCGNLSCSRYDQHKCTGMLKNDYKFYLSFENSNCQHYITEKFYQNALWNEVVPVVMGAHQKDYLAAAPPHSFIHVEDFASPRDLADYLLMLHHHDHLYNAYHQWRLSGHFINTKFWCRMCALLHESGTVDRWYPSIDKWWRRPEACTLDQWHSRTDLISDWSRYL